ncbi:MAG: response regulator [Rhodopirellula sp.]|nr:response regulator [Rhodopirellula sp.]
MSVQTKEVLQRGLEASDARFQAIVEQCADGILVVGDDLTIRFVNQQAAVMLGRTCAQLRGNRLEISIAKDVATEIDYLAPDGERRVAEMRAVEIQWQGNRAHLATLRDITQRKRREEENRKALRRRDQFLAVLSHELRTPLAAIVNASRILQRAADDQRVLSRARDVIDTQSRQMTRLLDDLLDVSRICEGKIELRKEAIDLRETIHQAVQVVLPLIGENRLGFDLDVPRCPIYVQGDPTRLHQIFANLLTNAAKYTEPGGHIRLIAEHDRSEVIVRIRDDGIGIDPDKLDFIFEPFVQEGSSLAKSNGGMGIGLALVRSLVGFHGGTVVAESKGLGRGSTFTVRLPLTTPARRTARHSAPESNVSEMRILVVEDNPNAREMLQTVLELDGHEVAVAESGLQGLEMIEFQRPEVALVDIGLPGLDGYQVARAVRKNPQNDGVFLVALTGYGQPDDRRQALDAGFDAHLVKPVDLERLNELFAERRRDCES